MKHSYIVRKTDQMKYFTHMAPVLHALEGRHLNYNWLITDLICNVLNPLQPDNNTNRAFVTGNELEEIVAKQDPQFMWAVFSALPKELSIDLNQLPVIPFGDGNRELWKRGFKNPVSGAEIEIVCWDSGLFLFLTDDDEVGMRFKKHFPEAEDLLVYNANLQKHSS